MIFQDKTVIITGGSEGCGAAAARLFADAGANLMLVARGKRKLEAIAEELRDKTRVEIFPMDVADTGACGDVFKKAKFEFGRVDILVNNAGYHQRGRFETVSAEDHAAMVDVNLRAPIMMTRIALPYLREAGGGAIINVGSLAGWQPLPDQVTYSATKSGLRTFTYALFEELRDTDIKVAIVSPGPLDTGFIMSNLDVVADLTMSQPISTAEEVAQAVLDLCGNRQREIAMPKVTAALSRFFMLFPWLKRILLPVFEAKGRRVKARLQSEAKRQQ
ncbi:MAG: SDR family NAD(P)-dependent oxidoreductase [Woeseiaceae bacterium]|nr:SDR family NAD(P)-dependent oxidoreductase [Woeseiaceae bacterium]